MAWQHEALESRQAEIASLRAQYSDLQGRIAGLRDTADDIVANADIETTQDGQPDGGPVAAVRDNLTDLAAANRKLTQRIARVRAGVRGADARAEELAAERDRLRRQLANAEAALAKVTRQREEARQARADLGTELTAQRAHRQAEAAGRAHAEAHADRLTARLDMARDRVTALRDELKAVEARLTASRTRHQALLAERARLADNVRALEGRLGLSSGDGRNLMARVSAVAKALRDAQQDKRSLASTRNKLRKRVASLESELSKLRERDLGLFKHFAERTGSGLTRVRETVAMTGVDVDKLVRRVKTAHAGAKGGPLVKLDAPVNDPIAKHASRLSRKMRRMLALQEALGSMPLTAPVESYWISSYFGKRRDPYTDEWAMHEGLDLAADAGSAVKATAPGKVVFAGHRAGYGRMVKVDHGLGLVTVYGHLKEIRVQQGERVGHREKVGELGNTGRSTGPHVHYEVRMDGDPADPMKFLKAGKHVFKG
ncbi:M23 family metallopeptidase [Limimonas halophila]|nr:M23 family metallopeptidase [Limimonas halophila]